MAFIRARSIKAFAYEKRAPVSNKQPNPTMSDRRVRRGAAKAK